MKVFCRIIIKEEILVLRKCCRKFLIWSYLLLWVSTLLYCQCLTHFYHKTICITFLFVHIVYGLLSLLWSFVSGFVGFFTIAKLNPFIWKEKKVIIQLHVGINTYIWYIIYMCVCLYTYTHTCVYIYTHTWIYAFYTLQILASVQ